MKNYKVRNGAFPKNLKMVALLVYKIYGKNALGSCLSSDEPKTDKENSAIEHRKYHLLLFGQKNSDIGFAVAEVNADRFGIIRNAAFPSRNILNNSLSNLPTATYEFLLLHITVCADRIV